MLALEQRRAVERGARVALGDEGARRQQVGGTRRQLGGQEGSAPRSVKVKGGEPVLARQLAMHISWSAPAWVAREDVPAETVASELDIFRSSDEVASKPEQAREKIVEGMLNKRFFAASPGGVLLEQPWIHDASKTVQQALQEAGAEVLAFERFQLG